MKKSCRTKFQKLKGPRNDPNNYRGIALVSCLLKLFTSILANRLVTWADENQIIPEHQNGFRRGRSCEEHIFTLSAISQFYLGRNRAAYIIFIDLQRAFDSINHSLLWSKLLAVGVSGKILRILALLYHSARM